jgi:ABC-2 type transport system permease protein
MKYGSKEKWFKFIIFLTVVVLINLVAGTLFFRLDLTENKSYSLSGASKSLVMSLEEPLTIRIFLSENLPQPYNNLELQMRDLMEEYSLTGNRNFNYNLYLLDQDGLAADEAGRNLRTMAESYNIPAIQIQNVEQDEVKLQTAYMGMVLIQGDVVETIPALASETNLEYKITSMINRISRKTSTMLSMEDPVKIQLILSPELLGLSEDLADYSGDLKKLVDGLNLENFGKLEFSAIDPSNLESKELIKTGLNRISLQSGSQENPVTNIAYAGILVSYGGDSVSINLLTKSLFGYSLTAVTDLEKSIGEIVEKLIGVNQSIAYLSDHGTPALSSNPYAQEQVKSVGNFNKLLSGDYNIKSVSLDNIPGDVKTLIINGPTAGFSEWELFQLDQFIMNGGSVAFFLDTHSELIPSQQEMMYGRMPTYTPLNTGLEKLISSYGVNLISSYVMDEDCYIQQNRNAMGSIEKTPIYFAPQIGMDKINNDVSFMKNIKGLIVLNISPLEINLEENSPVKGTVLFSSSDKSWTMSENINLYNPAGIFPPSTETRASQKLAALVEGPLNSYFDGRDIPPRPQPAEENKNPGVSFSDANVSDELSFINQSESGKIFVIGSSSILGDNVLDAAGTSPNAMMIQNVLDYLNGREDYAIMRSKGQGFNPLKDVDSRAKAIIKGINIIFLPILIILFGLGMWFRWNGRKKKIAAIFTEENN